MHACSIASYSAREYACVGQHFKSCVNILVPTHWLTPRFVQVNPAEERLARFTHCSLSGEPLSPPCCADELGSLYNKDAVVSALLKKVGLSLLLLHGC